MQGSLALSRGLLLVGDHAKTARVRVFDLGGRELDLAFSYRDRVVGRSMVAGLSVDEERSILAADTPADRVRRFSFFGREVGGIGGAATDGPRPGSVLPGLVTQPVDVEARGDRDQGWVAIACGGERRHALQLFDPDLSLRASLPALGDPGRPYRGLCRLASGGELLYAAEALGRCVQVFRAGAFLFAFHLTDARGERFEPSALAALGDGRLVVGCRGPRSALFLVDGAGRPLRQLASDGEEEGAVHLPTDAVVEAGADDRHARLFVIDRDGLRVQVFTLEGRCLGSISLSDPLAKDSAEAEPGRATGQGSQENKGGR
jgi:hypothetical protein